MNPKRKKKEYITEGICQDTLAEDMNLKLASGFRLLFFHTLILAARR